MTEPMDVRDERTIAVENASFRYAYLALSYGLLMAVAYRSFVLEQQSWDLLALVLLGGVLATTFQGKERVLTRRSYLMAAAGLVLGLVLAVVMALAR